ncbi:MAG: M48 family metalloprotease [Deltaproteobacteria bacterium]|nr:M48 family metalloprotease [Deltaproteobacteria bacterium]
MNDDIYPRGPSLVPANLTEPSPQYKRMTYLAVAAILGFVALFFGLAGWFAWTAYRSFSSLPHVASTFGPILVGIIATLLAVFLLSAIFLPFKRPEESTNLEVTQEEQPRLFEFLHKLADEAGAPRPNRVFLSHRVNAAVFYDLSIFNLLVPSKKNLEIGLGLANVLTLGEMKAVLAHEFGHFAQRSMAVGRWVYTAQQIAAHIVHSRGKLDSALRWISVQDPRVAWVGWGMRTIVWSIRSVLDTAFSVVVIAEKALSREMELQADLVAVSLTGSDSLIHALHRLGAADEALEAALDTLNKELGKERIVADLFTVQERALLRLKEVLADRQFGAPPPLASSDPASHRVFSTELAEPPRMWSSHPPNDVREKNAKRAYVAAPFDDRSAWILFDDHTTLRKKMTERLYAEKFDAAKVAPIETTLAAVDQHFGRAHLDGRYRGVYRDRAVSRAAFAPKDLFGPTLGSDAAAQTLDALYPTTLAADMERLRTLQREKSLLIGIQLRRLDAGGGKLNYRGVERKRRELPMLIADVEAELEALQQKLDDHERRCRDVHIGIAAVVTEGWAKYLRALTYTLHYAEHRLHNLADASGAFHNVLAVVTADGHVSGAERQRLWIAANDVHEVLAGIYAEASTVTLNEPLAQIVGFSDWSKELGEFKLPAPSNENLHQWVPVLDSWVQGPLHYLYLLKEAALDRLIAAEQDVARAFRSNETLPAPPLPPLVPSEYSGFKRGDERPRQTRLDWWDRFIIADGLVPTTMRLAVTAAVVAGVIWASIAAREANVFVYNGLGRTVIVTVGRETRTLRALQHARLDVSPDSAVHVEARTEDGAVIETLDETTSGGDRFLYNVAGAGVFTQETIHYGGEYRDSSEPIGAPKWLATDVDHVIDDPPRTISSKERQRRTWLRAITDPARQYHALGKEAVQAVAAAHARWDDIDAPNIDQWLNPSFYPAGKRAMELAQVRLAAHPNDMRNLRFEQDAADGDAAATKEVCDRHTTRAKAEPDNGDWQYLAARCAPGDSLPAFAALRERFPQHPWIAFSYGRIQARRGNFAAAAPALRLAIDSVDFSNDLATDAVRAIRAATPDGEEPDLGAQTRANRWPNLSFLLQVERGAQTDVPAWTALSQGRLADAVALASSLPEKLRHRLLIFVGASDGARGEDVSAALEPGITGVMESAQIQRALALREKRDVSAFATPDNTDKELAVVATFLDLAAKDPKRAEAVLRDVGADVHGIAYSAGLVLLGKKAPKHWRSLAKKLLFSVERPYFE